MPTTSNFGWTTPADTDLVKDGAAAIRTLGNGIDTSFLDLKGGTTGQILSKASNNDLDYTWITNDVGDITEVAAGTGISGGGISGAVTITNSMATAIDAKGDLVAGTGADAFARLAVGANGTVLTADSAEATGLKWATPSAGYSPTGYTLLNAGGTALTGATQITVSGISSQRALMIIVDGASSVNASSFITVRFNSDSAANYDGGFTNTLAASNVYSSGMGATEQYLGKMSSNAGSIVGATLFVDGANTTNFKALIVSGMGSANGGTGQEGFTTNGIYKGTSAITSVNVRSSTGNFDAGTVYVYGASA